MYARRAALNQRRSDFLDRTVHQQEVLRHLYHIEDREDYRVISYRDFTT